MSMQVLLLGAHPSRGHGLRRLSALLERAWQAAGAQVHAVTSPDAVSSRIPWGGAGRGLAAVESAAWLGQQIHRHGAGVDLVVVVDPRDAVWTSSLSGRVPVTVVCHDVTDLPSAGGEPGQRRVGAVERLRAPFVVKALARADHVLCTSETAARAVRRLTEHAPAVLHLPVDPQVAPPARHAGVSRQAQAPTWPYLLSVDSGRRQNRRDAVISVWSCLRRTPALDGLSLVIVGPPLTSDEQRRVTSCGGHVEVLQEVSDEHLAALYAGSRAVLALGHGAGFAWPVAEAHAAGRPVLAADDEGFEEVGADGCVYLPMTGIDVFDPPSWAMIAEDLTSTGLVARARANATRFTWEAFTARLPAASVSPRIAQAAHAAQSAHEARAAQEAQDALSVFDESPFADGEDVRWNAPAVAAQRSPRHVIVLPPDPDPGRPLQPTRVPAAPRSGRRVAAG